MSRILSVTVTLEDVAGVTNIRTVLHDAKGDGRAFVVTPLTPAEVECEEMLAVHAVKQMHQVVRHVYAQGIPNVPATETPNARP